MSWHADAELLDRYSAGHLSDAAAWSVETHIMGCDVCRRRLGVAPDGVGDDRLAGVWADVASRVRLAERSWMERAIVRLGVREHEARLLLATPSHMRSWLLGMAVVVVLAVAGAWASTGQLATAPLPFLIVAPLMPVAGVAAAFGPRVDPTHALAVVAPMSSFRLLLLRTAAVLTPSLLLAGVGAAALPSVGWAAAAWVLPALALTAGALAISTRWPPVLSAGMVAGTWVAVVMAVEVGSSMPLAAFGFVGQAVSILGLVLSLAVVARRRARFELATHV